MFSSRTTTFKSVNRKYHGFPARIRITYFKNTFYMKLKKGEHFTYNPRLWSGIVYVISGKLEFHFENQTIKCQADDSILISQGTSYKVHYLEDSTSVVFNFYTDENLKFPPITSNKINLYPSFKKIEEYSVNTSEHSYYAIMSELYNIVSKIFQSNVQKNTLLTNAIKIINDNFNDSTFLCKNISKMLNVSESYLRAQFKKVYGISPYRYMTIVRMQEATNLLINNTSITETALAVGYSDIFQFSKAFKKFYGYSPSDAKRMI